MRHIYQPRSNAQQTRRIVREQTRFFRGVLNDGPAKSAAPSGLHYGINVKPFDDRVEVRGGNRIWSDAFPYIAEDISVLTTGTTAISISSGYNITKADVGRYFRFSNGRCVPIMDIATSLNRIITNQDLEIGAHTGKIRAMVCAHTYHRAARYWVLHTGNKIYRARYGIDEWEEVPVHGYAPAEAKGRMVAVDKDVLLWNSNGLYRIQMSPTPVCYRLNEPCPSLGNEDEHASDPGEIKRRYLVSFSRLRFSDITSQRTSAGVVVEHQSGTNAPKTYDGINYTDYRERSKVDPISDEDPMTLSLVGPELSPAITPFTHYSVWGTVDVGPAGTDPVEGIGNDPESYWWLFDVPILRAGIVTAVGEYNAAVDGFTIETDVPFFVGSDSAVCYPAGDLTTGVPATANYPLRSVINSRKAYVSFPPSVGTVISRGARKSAGISQNGTTITWAEGVKWEAGDVGKLIALSTGEYDYIRSVAIDGESIEVDNEREIVAGAAAWEPITISFNDSVPDEELRVRRGFLLSQRWLTPMPNCNDGIVTPAFLAGIQSGGMTLYYCQRSERTLLGYHHPAHQRSGCDEPLLIISEFPNAIVAYGRNGIDQWDLAAVQQLNRYDDASVSRPVGQMPIAILLVRQHRTGHGVMDRGAVQKLPDGGDLVITRAREYRIYNGYEWGDNMMEKRLMKRLKKLGSGVACGYDVDEGFYHWGREET
jgi:hypothetical protein